MGCLVALDAWRLWLSVVVGGGSAFLGLGFGFGGIGQLSKVGGYVERGAVVSKRGTVVEMGMVVLKWARLLKQAWLGCRNRRQY